MSASIGRGEVSGQDHTQAIVVGGPRRSRRSGKESKRPEDDEPNLLLVLQQSCFENYHTFAYTIIICSYFIAFCLYLYLRLMSWIFPKKIIYKRHCLKHENESIVRMELHYASATATFLVMATFQLVCFFFLTISGKWLDVRRSFSNFISMEERLRNELVFAMKRAMFVTVLPTFAVYSLSSIVTTLAIFYMVGMRDPVNHLGSQVVIYFFDGCMCIYLGAFPLICVMYHPNIQLFAWFNSKRKLQGAPRRSNHPSAAPQSATTPVDPQQQQLPATTSRQRSQATQSNRSQEAPAPLGAGGAAPAGKQQSSSCSSTASGRSLQQWAKQLPLNPANLQHHQASRLRVDNASTTSKYRRLSDEIRQTKPISPINESQGSEEVVVAGMEDVIMGLGGGPRRRSSVNKRDDRKL